MFGIAYFRLAPRDRDEASRGSTSLELMFDLATVVAVASAAHGLAQDVEAGKFASGVIRFACSFFMTWLAWANYTWFASGYDNRSSAFRGLTMVIMFGSLTLAGGIRSGLDDQRHWLVLIGFSIMRLGMIALWLGAANGDRQGRQTALRYAAGIGAMQVYWNTLIILLSPQAPLYFPLFALGAVGELAVPLLAERKIASNWHHGHIIDRYNAFNIIVLGECFAAIALILSGSAVPEFRHFWWAGLCSVITFSMWGSISTATNNCSAASPAPFSPGLTAIACCLRPGRRRLRGLPCCSPFPATEAFPNRRSLSSSVSPSHST